jgi:hypothetical protein
LNKESKIKIEKAYHKGYYEGLQRPKNISYQQKYQYNTTPGKLEEQDD